MSTTDANWTDILARYRRRWWNSQSGVTFYDSLGFVLLLICCINIAHANKNRQDVCPSIGFPKATSNTCNYCVGEGTGLTKDYGTNCKGDCGPPLIRDCAGICDGDAYIDECTGECLGGTTGLSEDNLEDSKRDCRGNCLSEQKNEIRYQPDSCRVCAIEGSTTIFKDCGDKCFLPGEFLEMGKIECGTCVRPANMSRVHDECGECVSDRTTCSNCKRTLEVDACGLCGGIGASCLKITYMNPKAFNEKTVNKVITLKGAFRGEKENVICIFESDKTSRNVTAHVNGTVLNCKITLPLGNYTVSVEVMELDEKTTFKNKLIVYKSDQEMYSEMEPNTSSIFPENDAQEYVTVHFKRKSNALDLPLKCLISRKSTPKHKQLTNGSSDVCFIPYPEKSEKIGISATYNGFQEVSQPFEFTFFAPHPIPVSAFIAQDGSVISVSFNRPLNVCGLKCNCSNLFTAKTIEVFGQQSHCKLATKLQVVIFMSEPFKEDQIELVIKRGKLQEDQQVVGQVNKKEMRIIAKREPWDGNLYVTITGPNLVPVCGNISLIGHYSSPFRGIVTFTWTVHRLDSKAHVTKQLEQVIKGTSKSTLIFPSQLLEIGVNYTFTFLAASSDGISAAARHLICRQPYVAPLVTAYSTAMGSLRPIMADQEVILFLETTLPECISIPGVIHTLWMVSDPRVQFNYAYARSPVCRIEKNKLPEDAEITFTAIAYLENRLNETTLSSTVIKVAKMKMKAIIKGSSWRKAGDDTLKNASLIVIDGSLSNGYNLPQKYVRYHWNCLDQDMQPCYDFYEETENSLLIERVNQTQPVLKLHPKQLKAGQRLTISLRVFHALMPNESSDTTNITIDVEEGIVPQIIIEDISTKGYSVQERVPGSRIYDVPADAPVVIHVTVLSKRFRKVTCRVLGAVSGFKYNYIANNNKKHMLLPEDFLVAHGKYVVTWLVCRRVPIATECHTANITLYSDPGVSLCRLTVQPYIALTWTQAEVTGCSIPYKRLPVTYQLFIDNNGEKYAITGPQISNVFQFIGPQSPQGNDSTTFHVEVCDKIRQCSNFKSEPVEVEPNDNETQALETIELLAERASETGDPIQALSYIVIASQTNDTTFLEKNTAKIIKNVVDAIKLFPLLPGQAVLLYSVAQCLLKQEDRSCKKKALTAIEKSTVKTSSFKMPPNHKSINEAYALTANLIASQRPADQDMMKLIAKTQDELIKATAKSLPLGQRVTLCSTSGDSPVVLIAHIFINKEIITIHGTHDNKRITANLKFDPEVGKQFTSWDCKQENPCEGVILVISLFPGNSIHPDGSVGKRVGPVISVRFLTPVTVKEKSMYMKKGITLKLKPTSNVTKDAQCYKWDEASKQWMQSEEESSLGVVGERIECTISSHGVYTAIIPPFGMSGGTIAGITVATLMFVTIMGMVVMFFIRMKNTKQQNRVSDSA